MPHGLQCGSFVKAAFRAIGLALGDLRVPRVLVIALAPVLGALVLWCMLLWLFWKRVTDWMAGLLGSMAWARWLREAGWQWLVDSAGALSVIAVVLPLLMITTVLFTEIFAMPALIRYVGERHYARLEQRRGGTVLGSTLNAVVSITMFLVLWIVTLPLWLTGIAGAVLPPFLSAFLAQRVFRYDALSEHAGADEYRAIVSGARGRLFVLGLLLAPLIYVPVLNLFTPALSALAFTHFCLRELAALREGGYASRT